MEEKSETLRHILRSGYVDFQKYLNPHIYQRAKLSGEPIEFTGIASGALIEKSGAVFEDFHGTQAFGHRNPHFNKWLQAFLESDAPSWYPSRVSPFSGHFAKLLCERSGFYERAYFSFSGSDAVEATLKLARTVTRRPRILGLEGGYHGCTYGSVSLMQAGPFRDPFGPHLPGAESIPFGDISALEKALETKDVAAIVVEPIQGEGGVRKLPEAYVEALCRLTLEHGTLLVADEVQTALGRSGRFLASENWPRRPDAVTLAKALGGGIVPISAMLTSAKLFDQAYGQHFEAAEAHNATFSFNAMGAVAGIAMLELLTEETIENIRKKGEWFRELLREELAACKLFLEVSGDGLMIGIKFRDVNHPWLGFKQFGYKDFEDRPTIALLICMRMYKRKTICYPCGHSWQIVRLQPRFDIEEEKLREVAVSLKEELLYLEGLM